MDIVRARVLLVLATVLVLLATNMGCLSIHGMRDLLVIKKSSPPLVYQKNQVFTSIWKANGIVRPDTLADTKNILVKPGTRYLDLTYNIALVSGVVARQINYTLPTSPYVTLRLRTPTGEVFWEGNFTEPTSKTTEHVSGPSAGKWVLRMEAQGYGGTIPIINQDVNDQFQVWVDLYEPK